MTPERIQFDLLFIHDLQQLGVNTESQIKQLITTSGQGNHASIIFVRHGYYKNNLFLVLYKYRLTKTQTWLSTIELATSTLVLY